MAENEMCGSLAVLVPEWIRPERKLLLAILERSMLDLNLVDIDNQEDALEWFKHKGDEPWSFIWICEQLSLPYEALLNRLLTREAYKPKSQQQVTKELTELLESGESVTIHSAALLFRRSVGSISILLSKLRRDGQIRLNRRATSEGYNLYSSVRNKNTLRAPLRELVLDSLTKTPNQTIKQLGRLGPSLQWTLCSLLKQGRVIKTAVPCGNIKGRKSLFVYSVVQ